MVDPAEEEIRMERMYGKKTISDVSFGESLTSEETKISNEIIITPEEIEAKGVWRNKKLFWRFTLGKMAHEISDVKLRVWLRDKSGLSHYQQPLDGIIRENHTSVYIEKELLNA